MKGRNHFSKSESAQIKELLDQKIKSGNLKIYRQKLRSIGFYSDDFKRVSGGFSAQDFDELVRAKRISVVDELEAENSYTNLQAREGLGLEELRGFPPVASRTAKLLILGTFPGTKSLDQGEYYAATSNKFWFIIEKVFGVSAVGTYQNRIDSLNTKRIAIWDVLMSCKRYGSSDKSIRTPKPNDFGNFFTSHREIEAIFFNGQEAKNYYKRLVHPVLSDDLKRLPQITLPSSSGAYIKPPIIKADIWKEKFERQGLQN